MSSHPDVAQDVLSALSQAGDVSSRRMFGEYAIYLNDRVVGFVCDDQLFLKITPGSTALIKEPVEGQAYPGSKPYYVVSADYWDDAEYMAALARAIASEVDPPKPRRRRPKA